MCNRYIHKANLKSKLVIISTVALYCYAYVAFAATNRIDLNVDTALNVTAEFPNVANVHVVDNGSIIGNLLDAKSLHIGRGKGGTLRPNNFTTQGVIGGVTEITVHKNSSFTSLHTISGVTKGFTVDENAILNLTQPLIGDGIFNNYGEVNVSGQGGLIGCALSNSGTLNISNNFKMPSKILRAGDIYVVGNGKINGYFENANLSIGKDSRDNINPNQFIMTSDLNYLLGMKISQDSSLTVPTNITFNPQYTVDGVGIIYNYGIFNFTNKAYLASTLQLENYGTLHVSVPFTFSNQFVNKGKIYLTASANPIGDILDGESIDIGKDHKGNISMADVTNHLNIRNVKKINIHKGTLATTGVVQNCGIVTNFDNLQIKNLFNSESIINHSGATLSLETSKLQSPVINKEGGYLYVTQNTNSNCYVENSGLMHVSAPFTIPAINNIGYLKSNAEIVTQTLTNSGILSSNAAILADVINNFANFNSSQKMHVKILNNSGELLIAGNVIADVINNHGTMNIKGNTHFTVEQFNSPGVQNFCIKNAIIYDNLISNAAINFENGTVNIKTHFMGEPGINYEWNIISARDIIKNDNTIINIPHSGLHYAWHSSTNNGILNLRYYREPLTKSLVKGLSLDIAKALEQIALESKDEASVALLHAVCDCADPHQYATNLTKLIPNANSNAHFVSMHNATFKKVETRISALQNSYELGGGVAAGDLIASRASWGAIFGSFANQSAITENPGYHASAVGAIFGFDKQVPNDDIYGAALAFSRSNIDEAASINSKTNISGYHFLIYGTNFFYGDNFFEWLFTGIINQNKSEREVILNGVNLNVGSTYHNYQTGVRVNLGKNMDFHSWGLAQVNTAQYSFLHQPAYNENGSPAALHLSSYNSNVVTIGSGLRIFCRPDFHSALVAKPAIHAMLTYDAVNSSKGINANFIVGGSDFTINQNPARLAVKLGADLGCEINERLQLQFSYDLELRSRYNDNSLELKLKYLF